MRGGWIGLVAIALAVAAIVATKQVTRARVAAPSPGATASRVPPATVLLFADPREAGTECICGEIFKAVREAASRGLAVREIDPRHEEALARRHHVVVEPTLIVLDASGREVSRHEGESREALAATRSDLARLTPR